MAPPSFGAPKREARSSSSAGAWIKQHKTAATGLAVAAGIAGIYLYEHNKSAAASSPTGSSVQLPAVARGNANPSYGALEAQIAALRRQIDNLTKKPRGRKQHPPKKKPPKPPGGSNPPGNRGNGGGGTRRGRRGVGSNQVQPGFNRPPTAPPAQQAPRNPRPPSTTAGATPRLRAPASPRRR